MAYPGDNRASLVFMNATGSRMFVGSWRGATSLAFRESMNVTHVLNCTQSRYPEGSVGDLETTENYLQLPLDDSEEFNPCEYLTPGVEFIERALAEPNTTVLVHCHQGINRSAMLAAAYLIWQTEVPFDATEAIAELRRRRGGAVSDTVLFNTTFRDVLENFSIVCARRNGGDDALRQWDELVTQASSLSTASNIHMEEDWKTCIRRTVARWAYPEEEATPSSKSTPQEQADEPEAEKEVAEAQNVEVDIDIMSVFHLLEGMANAPRGQGHIISFVDDY